VLGLVYRVCVIFVFVSLATISSSATDWQERFVLDISRYVGTFKQ